LPEAPAPGGASLGLGTATFIADYGIDGAPGPDDPAALIAACVEAGVRYIDTSAHYGNVETVLGAQRALLARHRARLCVKVAVRDWPGGVDEALVRLGVDGVDTVMLHSARGPVLRDPRVGDTMARVKATRRAARTGASTYGSDDARYVLEQPWGDAVQIEHSILNPSVARALGPGKRPGQEIVVRSVLCRGLLTSRRREAPHVGGGEVAAVLERLDAIADAWGFGDLAELAIRFALDSPFVDVVLVGIASPAELKVALSAAGRPPLSVPQLDALRAFDHSAEDWTHPERWVAIA
jgi:aryl-alcohol dehydrogenase-like predicted oxidoreductase